MDSLPEFSPLVSNLALVACAVIGYLIVSWIIDFLKDRSAFNKKSKGDFLPDDTSGDGRRDGWRAGRQKGDFR